ncbi:MAG: Helix-turn-helix domain [Pseudomonadota bacterium]
MLSQGSLKSRSCRAELLPKRGESFIEKLIGRKELAQFLGVSPSFISKMMVLEGLPHVRIGRAVRFDVNEVRKWLFSRRKP